MTCSSSSTLGAFALAALSIAACSTPDGPSGTSSSSAGGGAPHEVTIELHDGDSGETLTTPALFFEKIDIRVAGLDPHARATLHGAMGAYASEATFEANADGSFSTLTDAPVSGTYDEADPDGLFWSMSKTDPNATLDSLDVHLSVEVDNEVLAEADLARSDVAPGVTREDVDMGSGIVGALYTPADPGPHPVVIGYGGSEGGLYFGEIVARSMASIGYTSIGVAYFGADGLPATLTDVPLEYFGTVIEWISARPEADPTRIAVMGASRGGELSLLLGAHYPEVKAVVAVVPSDLVWGSTASYTAGAWTWEGAEIPRMPVANVSPAITKADDGKNVYHDTPTFLASIDQATPAQIDAATTHAEDTKGPVLMFGGAADELWPSCQLAQIAMDRLQASGHSAAYADEIHCYPDAGHFTNPLNVGFPMTNASQIYEADLHAYLALGGTPKGLGHAARDAWVKTRAFLAAALR